MAPRKKTSNMAWVRKSHQSTNMAEPATEKNTSSMMSESYLLLVSKLQLSPSPSAKMAQPSTKEPTFYTPSWSLLPEELLHIISQKLEDCFDIIHARSVCRQWRSIFPYPSSSCPLRTTYSLPSFDKFPRRSSGSCTLEKLPTFLFRVRSPTNALPSEFFVGGISQDKSEDHIKIPSSSIQCSVKVKMGESDPTLVNILDCQILPLGYQYRMIGYDPDSLATRYRGVALLPLDKEGRGEFVVLMGYAHDLLVLRSGAMRWMQLNKTSRADCKDIITCNGKFYVVFINGDVFVIDPYSLDAAPLMNLERLTLQNYLVPCGDDELFLVERVIVRNGVLCFSKMACRVSRLDEEAGEWVVVNDLGDRVLLIGQPGTCSGNSSFSAKELPDGCGVSGDSMLFITEIFDSTYSYKYGVDTGNPEDDLSFWRSSKETCVTILCKSPMVALRIDYEEKS
ncbi:unnamed protein product [Thlaspi arvense]|uniref:F-box domain-containing protein n=1 Tax=Thlaspi arvense TaxID=13288 RepID=A0AAU9SF11_THLAR|nr:unnamed protein product [Thlaspi arvense]